MSKEIKSLSTKTKRYSGIFLFLLIAIGFISGGFAGMILQQQLLYLGLGNALSELEGITFNVEVDFNETLMMEEAVENMEPIFWDVRMQNCTKTEKGYCAIECYENSKLIPCENFTADEHFCDNGKCEVAGVCPSYYEQLRGETIGDCIKEMDEMQ